MSTKHLNSLIKSTAVVGLILLSACATVPKVRRFSAGPASVNPHAVTALELHRRLVGTWLAIDKQGDLKAGTIAFYPNGTAIIAPNAAQPLIGTWTSTATKITIHLPHNATSRIGFRFYGKNPVLLSLHFKNGRYKKFIRLPVKRELHHEDPAVRSASSKQ